MKNKRQIIALGGGGFSMEPRNLRLDKYILNNSRSRNPKICFLATASGDAQGYIDRFYKSFSKLACRPSHISLFKNNVKNIEKHILDQDVIYVGGGNTHNMLLIWKDRGLDRILKKAYQKGVILCGLSAGSICWFEQGVTDSFDGLATMNAMGFLKGSHCPHYDGEKNRRPVYHKLIQSKKITPGYAVDDSAALHFVDGKVAYAVTSRKGKKAYFVGLENGRTIERSIEAEYLSKDGEVLIFEK